MREFFHSWRRKAGCGLLVVASLFAAGWVRSLRKGDLATLSMGKIALGVHSDSGVFKVLGYRIFGQGLNGMFAGEQSDWTSFNVTASISADGAGEVAQIDGYDQGATFCGISLIRSNTYAVIVEANEAETRSEVTSLAIPYSHVALPLSLLSAYLVLWKPRRQA